MTTDDVIARFENEYLGYNNITAERARQQVKLLREFEAFMGKPLIEADAGDLQGFAAHLVKRKLHVNTVRKKLNQIRPFVSWAYQVNLIDADRYMKLRGVRNPRGATGNTLPNPYKRTEVLAFWAELHDRLPEVPEKGRGSQALKRWLSGKSRWVPTLYYHGMRLQIEAIVRLALDMGLRRSEIYGLSVDDLHYDNEYLVVRGKADPNTGHAKIREVPFTDTARRAVFEWLEFRALMRCDHNRPWVTCYYGYHDQPMRQRRFNGLLQDVVGDWRLHRFRHTCGTTWLRAGMELEKVQRLLGHATLQQTLGYAEIIKGDLAKSMAKHAASFEEEVGHAA